MRLDTGNRSLLGLVTASFFAYLLVGIGVCVLLSLLVYRVSIDGLGALTTADHDLRPALVFLLLGGVGVILGLWSLGTQLASSFKLSRRVQALSVPTHPDLATATKRTRLSGRVKLVDAEEPFSFTYGVLTPRVAVSKGLVEATSPSELDAVLEHERYHVRNLDPLKVLLARALPPAFFYLPALRDLRTRYIAGRELAADRRAVEACDRNSLAGALMKVVRGPVWAELKPAAAIGGSELLDARVAQLENGREPRITGISRTAALLSTLGLGVLMWSFVASVGSNGGLRTIIDSTVTGMHFEPIHFALSLIRIALLVAAAWLLYHWISRRARRELDTTST